MKRILPLSILLLLYACTSAPGPRRSEIAVAGGGGRYPPARQAAVVDDYHGTPVPDPYRWMEDPDDAETLAWVTAQNELTRAYLDAIPAREKLLERITELWNYPRYEVPERHGDHYYYLKNDGLQDQSVLYRALALDAAPEVVLDPNAFSADGTIALTDLYFSHDGRYLAYGTAESGSDWQTYRIRDLRAGEDLSDEIRYTKFTSIAWQADNAGFYYTRFPEEGLLDMTVDQTRDSKVFWHALGTPQSRDRSVYFDADHPDYGYSPEISEDGQYLFIYEWHGTDDRNGLLVRSGDDNGPFTRLIEVGEAEFLPLGNIGSRLFVRTNLDAPRSKVFSMDLAHRDRSAWTILIPEGEDAISTARLAGGRLVVQTLHNATERMHVYDLDGELIRAVDLPTLGTVGRWWGREPARETELFYAFTSFLYPSTVFRYDLATGATSRVWASTVNVDPAGYETKQVWYSSKDGTRVSMFITHRKGIVLDGDNPTLLYGYGGFNIPILPRFSITRAAWMELGGVYAVANLRGGSEYGEDWHQGGMLANKQNVFDDFIAAAQFLIDDGITRRERLAIDGGSNGGLLVAACLLQRPNLFGAAVSRVPVIDMLRYHRFTAGRYWTGEYGNAEEDPSHFRFMYAYSPLHNVRAGTAYPPTFITTADTDDRVVSMHAKKFAATLQAADAGTNPILIRIETKAGHGAGKPTSKRIAEAADIYAFLFQSLGMEAR
ncbi:MAG: prolyl oligopeptidase family serine peptidase [Candidatus Neomarinimicrobiota bacterium]